MVNASTSVKGEASSASAASSEEFAAELAALRADVAALAKSVGGYSKTRAAELRDSAEAATEDLLVNSRKALKDLRKQIVELEGGLETRVKEHPLQTLMVALGLGILLSLIIRR